MTTPWFFAPPPNWHEDHVVLDRDESHHAARVLRVSPPDVITVTDGRGNVARCAVESVDDGGLAARVLERTEHRRPRPEIVVYQAAVKGHKNDEIVQKLAELGVSEAWVFQAGRSVVSWDRSKIDKLTARWDAMARGSAKQSRNPFAMHAGAGLSWTELLRRVAKEPAVVVLWEEASLPLRTALLGEADRVALVVGPEGGFERDEAEALADAGAQLVSLGPVILRTENAPVVAVSALLYHYGLIG
jgi:16S rRNA (uracil1498-N3)-methyltransferase